MARRAEETSPIVVLFLAGFLSPTEGFEVGSPPPPEPAAPLPILPAASLRNRVSAARLIPFLETSRLAQVFAADETGAVKCVITSGPDFSQLFGVQHSQESQESPNSILLPFWYFSSLLKS